MDYEKAYKSALERAREFQKSKDGLCVLTAESIFPELQESEDEKMWKLIKKYAHCNISAMALNADNISRKELETWLEKQSEKKVSSVDFKAKDWYVSNVDGKIHDVAYNAADNVEKKGETKNEQEALNNWYVEYVYILDYSTGRVIVAKHDVEESISELFEQLGLKESQCHYMTSSNILSIEYINF